MSTWHWGSLPGTSAEPALAFGNGVAFVVLFNARDTPEKKNAAGLIESKLVEAADAVETMAEMMTGASLASARPPKFRSQIFGNRHRRALVPADPVLKREADELSPGGVRAIDMPTPMVRRDPSASAPSGAGVLDGATLAASPTWPTPPASESTEKFTPAQRIHSAVSNSPASFRRRATSAILKPFRSDARPIWPRSILSAVVLTRRSFQPDRAPVILHVAFWLSRSFY